MNGRGARAADAGDNGGSVVQGTATAVAVTAAVEAKKLRATGEAGRGNEKGVQRQNPSPPLIGLPG